MSLLNIFNSCRPMAFGAKVAHLCGWCNKEFTNKCSLCGSKICVTHGTQMCSPSILCPGCFHWKEGITPKRINYDGCKS